MADQDAKMVLRTVYLPPELDEQLRVRAFRSKTTKNDLIREAVARWIAGETAGVQREPAKAKAKAKRSTRARTRTARASAPKAAATKA